MKEMVRSSATGKSYCPSDVIRIVNMRQCATYLLHGAELLDLYGSRDFKTNEPILVAIFDKEKTKDFYKLWCGYDLK